jgi:hypothetical protein
MVVHPNAITEIHGYRLPKAQCPPNMFGDLGHLFLKEPEVATGLAATKRGPIGQKMKGCPNPNLSRWVTMSFNNIDAKPQAGTRQIAYS